MRLTSTALLVVASTVLLAGCYESADVTVHEAGIYKGRNDPLIAKTATLEHQDTIAKRFNMVQTDR